MKKNHIVLFFVFGAACSMNAMKRQKRAVKNYCFVAQTGSSLLSSYSMAKHFINEKKTEVLKKGEISPSWILENRSLALHWGGYLFGSFLTRSRILSLLYLPVVAIHTAKEYKNKKDSRVSLLKDYIDTVKKSKALISKNNIEGGLDAYLKCMQEKECCIDHSLLHKNIKKTESYNKEFERILNLPEKKITWENREKVWINCCTSKKFDEATLMKK